MPKDKGIWRATKQRNAGPRAPRPRGVKGTVRNTSMAKPKIKPARKSRS